jgi:hypothetical protein
MKDAMPEAPAITVTDADVPIDSSPNLAQRNVVPEDEPEKPTGQGIAGKINVLMAADVESVLEGRDLPLVFVYTPVQMVLCAIYLYRLLSWSESPYNPTD